MQLPIWKLKVGTLTFYHLIFMIKFHDKARDVEQSCLVRFSSLKLLKTFHCPQEASIFSFSFSFVHCSSFKAFILLKMLQTFIFFFLVFPDLAELQEKCSSLTVSGEFCFEWKHFLFWQLFRNDLSNVRWCHKVFTSKIKWFWHKRLWVLKNYGNLRQMFVRLTFFWLSSLFFCYKFS